MRDSTTNLVRYTGSNKFRLRLDADRFASEFGWSTSSPTEASTLLYEKGGDSILVKLDSMKANSFFSDVNKEPIYRIGLSIYNLRMVFENPELRTWISWCKSDKSNPQLKKNVKNTNNQFF